MYICDLYLRWELETELEQLLNHVSYISFTAAAAAAVVVVAVVVVFKRGTCNIPRENQKLQVNLIAHSQLPSCTGYRCALGLSIKHF